MITQTFEDFSLDLMNNFNEILNKILSFPFMKMHFNFCVSWVSINIYEDLTLLTHRGLPIYIYMHQ